MCLRCCKRSSAGSKPVRSIGISASIALLSVALLAAGCPVTTVTVPNVAGLTLSQAESAVFEAGLVVGEIAEQHSDTFAVDRVIAQDPGSGESLEEGQTVNLTVSLGPSNGEGEAPPVYVALTGHIEDGEYYTECAVYPGYRRKLLDFAKMIHNAGAVLNLQIAYEFFKGASDCETETMMEQTADCNTIDYLAREYGFEIDAHHEGAWDWESDNNYADTRYFGESVTPLISDTVGGVVWDYALQIPQLDQGQQGKMYPGFTWRPEIMTCAVCYQHHLGDFADDNSSSGIWIPAGPNENFEVHDPDGRMVYVGAGPHGNWGDKDGCAFQSVADYVEVLVDYLERGVVEPKMFTATIAFPQKIIFQQPEKAEATLQQLAPLVDEGKVVYATYTEIVDTWRTQFDSEPNIFTFDQINPADYTCR